LGNADRSFDGFHVVWFPSQINWPFVATLKKQDKLVVSAVFVLVDKNNATGYPQICRFCAVMSIWRI
jgi:hypothetical protein